MDLQHWYLYVRALYNIQNIADMIEFVFLGSELILLLHMYNKHTMDYCLSYELKIASISALTAA